MPKNNDGLECATQVKLSKVGDLMASWPVCDKNGKMIIVTANAMTGAVAYRMADGQNWTGNPIDLQECKNCYCSCESK